MRRGMLTMLVVLALFVALGLSLWIVGAPPSESAITLLHKPTMTDGWRVTPTMMGASLEPVSFPACFRATVGRWLGAGPYRPIGVDDAVFWRATLYCYDAPP